MMRTIKSGNTKVTLEQLNREELWTTVLGGDAGAHDVVKLYRRVPWLYRGTSIRAGAVAGLPYKWIRGENEIDRPDLGFAFPIESWFDKIEAWLTLYGAAYIFKGTNLRGRPRFPRLFHPSTMRVEFGETESGIVKFKRAVNNRIEEYDPEQIVYIWLPSREVEVGPGEPPAVAALNAAQMLNNIDKYGTAFFDKGAIRPTLITLLETMNENDPQVERVQRFLRSAISGLKNAFKFQAITKNVEFKTLGDPLKDLAVPELTQGKREDIATAMGVPHSLLFSNAANYATALQDDIHFYDKTVVPEAELICRAINEQLLGGYDIELMPDPSQLEIYQQQEAQKADRMATLVLARIFTVDEARAELGKQPLSEIEQPQEPTALPPQVIDGDTRSTTAYQADLRRWRDKAVKRYREGHPEKALEFETDNIPASVQGWIQGALDGVNDAGAVPAVFQMAATWEQYP